MQIKCVSVTCIACKLKSDEAGHRFLSLCHTLFVCCRLLNNAASGAWGSDVACVCADCCQFCGFPAELGYFNTVAAGYFSCPRVEATPITWYLAPGMRTLPGNPPRNAIGLVLSSNWAGFVAKTWQPCGPWSETQETYCKIIIITRLNETK